MARFIPPTLVALLALALVSSCLGDGDRIGSHGEIKAKRAADQLTEYVEKMSKIARVANAVSLQSGLLDGSIPINDAVSELLNFGSFSVPAVFEFDSEKILVATTKLSDVSFGFASTKESTDAENNLMRVETIRTESQSIRSFSSLEGIDEFFAGVVNVQNGSYSVLTPSRLQSSYEILKNFDSGISEDRKKIYTDDEMNSIFKKIPSLKDEVTALPKFLRSLKSMIGNQDFDVIRTGVKVLKPLETMSRLLKEWKNVNPTLQNLNFDDNSKKAAELSTSFSDAQLKFDDISELLKAHVYPERNDRKYTNGFGRGMSDLQQFVSDQNDSWVHGRIGADGKSEMFTKGFAVILKMEGLLKNIGSSLNSVATLEYLGSAQRVSRLQIDLSDSPSSDDVKNTVNSYETCLSSLSATSIGQTSEVEDLIGKAKQLPELTATIEKTLRKLNSSDFEQATKDLVYIQSAIKRTNNFLDTEKLPLFKDLRSHPQFINLLDFLEKILTRLQEIKTLSNGATLSSVAKEISSRKTTVESFKIRTDVLDAAKMHTCLQDVEGSVGKTIRLIRRLRSSSLDKSAKDVKSMVNAIADLKKEVTTIETLPDNLKKGKTEDVEALSRMSGSLKVSTDIGRAVHAIRHMFDLSQKTSAVETLKKNGGLVAKRISALKKRKRRSPRSISDIKEKWGDHSKDMSSLEAVLSQIRKFESSIDLTKATNLSDYAVPFKTAKNVKSVAFDPMVKLEALDMLIAEETDQSIKDQLLPIRTALEQLAGLDLAFANYHASFAAAGPSLQSLSDFLLGFFNPPIPETTTTEAPPPTDYSWIWITALCLVGAVALGVGIYFLRKWCIKQEAKRRWEMRFELNRGETNRKIDLRMMYAVKTWRTGIEGFVMKISVDPSCLAKLTKWAFAMGSGGPDKARKTIDCPEKNRDDGVPLYEENSTVSILNMPKEKFWYHSSELVNKDGQHTIVAQSPMAANLSLGKVDTRPDFWLMVWLRGCGVIVHAGEMLEKGIVACDEYYPTEIGKSTKYGQVTVKYVKDEELPFQYTHIVGKVFEITYEGDKSWKNWTKSKKSRTRTVFHYQIKNWYENGCPPCAIEISQLLDLVAEKKKESKMDVKAPAVYHSSRGRTRAMMLLAIDYLTYIGARLPGKHPNFLCEPLRKLRVHGSGDATQVLFVLHTVSYQLSMKYFWPTLPKDLQRKEWGVRPLMIFAQQQEMYPGITARLLSDTKTRPKAWESVKAWIKSNIMEDHDSTVASMAYLREDMMRFGNEPETEENKRKGNRKGFPLIKGTAVRVTRDNTSVWIDANRLSTRRGTQFILTQVPKDGTGKDEDNTNDDFWSMVFAEKTQFVVQLCQPKEQKFVMPAFIPEKGKLTDTGHFLVTTKSAETADGIETCIIELFAKAQKETRVVTLLHDVTWNRTVPNHTSTTSLSILRIVARSPRPVVVVCETGSGRSLAFAAVAYVASVVELEPQKTFAEILGPLRQVRTNPLPSQWYIYFVQYHAIRMLTQDYYAQEDLADEVEQMYKLTVNEYVYNLKPRVSEEKVAGELQAAAECRREQEAREAAAAREEEWRRRERRAELIREDDERRARKRERKMRKLEERRQRGELSEASEERHRKKRQRRAAKLAKQGRRVNENDIEGLNEIGPERL